MVAPDELLRILGNRTIHELFPGSYCPSWEEFVESFGFEVLLCAKVGGYQGDLIVLLREGQRYGYLTLGYGSCGGCDMLEGCSSYRELDGLWKSALHEIHWELNKQAMYAWLSERDWEGCTSWGSQEDGASALDSLKSALAP